MSKSTLEPAMKHLISELYARRVNQLFAFYKTIDDEIASRFLNELQYNEKMFVSSRKGKTSALEALNQRCLDAWTSKNILDFSSPEVLEVYAQIFIFIERINIKFEREISLTKNFDPDFKKGGKYGNQTNN